MSTSMRHKALLVVTAVGLIASVFAGVARADYVVNSIENDLDAAREERAVAVGGTGTVKLWVQNQNDDAGDTVNPCNLRGSGTSITMSVSSSDTDVATVSPSQITIDDCDNDQNGTSGKIVTITGVANGTADIDVTFASTTPSTLPGTFDFAPAQFKAKVGTGVKGAVDPCAGVTAPAAPVIASTPASNDGNSGWFRTVPTVSATSSTPGATISYATDGATFSATAPTLGEGTTTVTAKATSATCARTSTTTREFKVDTVAPVVNPDSVSSTTWRNTDLSQGFTSDDTTSGLADPTDASFTLTASDESTKTGSTVDPTVASRTVYDVAGNSTTRTVSAWIDKGKPTITADTNGYQPGTWTNQSVTVDFTCADDPDLSGVATNTVEGGTVGTNGADQQVTNSGTCTDNAGNTADRVTVSNIDIDKAKPVITADTHGYVPGTWTNQDVTVTFSCTDQDGLSGIDEDDVGGATLTTSGADQEVTSGTCTDNAGNTADPVTVSNIDIDKDKPVITANTNGYVPGTWTNQSVTVDFTCTDDLSGTAGSSVAGKTLTSSGADQEVTNSGTCTDDAGNTADPVTVSNIDIDKDKPVITANTNGYVPGTWTNQSVTVDFTCTDQSGLSGIDENTVAAQTLSTSGADQSATNPGTCIDHAGNTADPVTVTDIDIDKLAPTVVLGGVTAGEYKLGSVPTATCQTTDTLSGVKTHASVVTSGGPLGSVTVSCSGAEDNAGNSNTGVTVTYTVVYDWSGFFQPIDNNGIWNKVKAGSAVPVKFSLGGNQGLNIFAAGYPKAVQVNCPAAATVDQLEELATGTTSGLKYDALAMPGGQYNYTWKTTSTFAGKCYRLDVTLVDGTTHSANFQFTK